MILWTGKIRSLETSAHGTGAAERQTKAKLKSKVVKHLELYKHLKNLLSEDLILVKETNFYSNLTLFVQIGNIGKIYTYFMYKLKIG